MKYLFSIIILSGSLITLAQSKKTQDYILVRTPNKTIPDTIVVPYHAHLYEFSEMELNNLRTAQKVKDSLGDYEVASTIKSFADKISIALDSVKKVNKYGPWAGKKILKHEIWFGMTKEMCQESVGSYSEIHKGQIGNDALDTLFYNHPVGPQSFYKKLIFRKDILTEMQQ